MKSKLRPSFVLILISSLLAFLSLPSLVLAQSDAVLSHLEFKRLSTLTGLPTDEVQKVYQDKDGLMWFATRYGFCHYDGYDVTLYKSNLDTPDLITNNNVYCLVDDYEHGLWAGTQDGLNVLYKRTGLIKSYRHPLIPNNSINCMLAARDHTVWIGTDGGLCRYDSRSERFVTYDYKTTHGTLKRTAIKALYEDCDGDIWIGTWSEGLYRYSPATGKWFAYPQFNTRNSAHVIFQDSQKTIWIGSWDCGLFRLDHPKEMNRACFVNYSHQMGDDGSLSDNIVYAIIEDLNTQSLWVGTRSGLSLMKIKEPGRFINYTPKSSVYKIPYDEINSLISDCFGNIWLGSIGGGVFMVDTHKPLFKHHVIDFSKEEIPTTAIRSLFADLEGNLWIGVGSYGLACRNGATGSLTLHTHIPEFKSVTLIPSVYAAIQRKNRDIWFGTYNGGIFVYHKGVAVQNLTASNSPFIVNDCISALFEDSHQNCWVGTRGGLGVRFSNGQNYCFKQMNFTDGTSLDWFYIKAILEDSDHSMWLGTSNYGVIHVVGDIHTPEKLKFYHFGLTNKALVTNAILTMHRDQSNQLWVGTEGGGLYCYDRNHQRFVSKNREYSIPGDIVGSIEEDKKGNLWLGTNAGLVKLNRDAKGKKEKARVYTTADGLQDNFFISGSSCSYGGELFFGGYKGYNSFCPGRMEDRFHDAPFLITDIKLSNKSFSSLPRGFQERLSKEMPTFTQRLELPYECTNFCFEFAALTYKNPELNQYAYRLVGFDKEWQYTNANRRFAYYNNLKSGTYKFQLKATNENGVWSGYIREVTVIVLPPFWATWWAYVFYFVMLLLAFYWGYKALKKRVFLRHELQMREMERLKSEELNHAKLQFFTNITHELLTPLTIISASLDELKIRVPGQDDLYLVMNNNVQRLIRLLQQILEFRKTESGHLKLKVSSADLVAFVKGEVESFRPLIKQKNLQLDVFCEADTITGYFDADKLDKIIYNLLSNAAKYNKEGGHILFRLSFDSHPDYIVLSVKNDGSGISVERQKELFKRFYEGDYRKFKTIGTGIGLALTKDLVELHQGSIRCVSELNQGTEFVVRLPIGRSYFTEEQIDGEESPSLQKPMDLETPQLPVEQLFSSESPRYSILVVEDNEELLQLMVKLLSRDYRVFTALNGEEALDKIERELIDLIVSDVMMPVMDGIELCKVVKKQIETSHIPIILLTAKNKSEDRAEAYDVGADAFISKPFTLAVLYARIRNLLRVRERAAHDFKNQLVFEVKEFNYTSLDEDFMQRAIDCVQAHLSDSEFDQLQFVEEMHTSKSTLYKKLKSLTGLNTSGFIRNIRLKAACEIIQEKGSLVRISELAYAVGFNDPKYFSVCFKKEFGMLPSEYIDQCIVSSSETDH